MKRNAVFRFDSLKDAHTQALQHAAAADRVVVFGSFHTAAAALTLNDPTIVRPGADGLPAS